MRGKEVRMLMSQSEQLFAQWKKEEGLLSILQSELTTIEGQTKEIEDRFYQYLSFGTGGMRGLIGAGTNRMNIYTIRRVAEGLAKHIQASGKEAMNRGVVIAYDTRHFSYEFALETAKTIGKYGIRVYVFKESRPTPELSFALRHLNAFSGVVITASHNPAAYNGFKVYGEDGGQLPPEAADKIVHYMNEIEDVFSIEVQDEKELEKAGQLVYILEEIDEAYQEALATLQMDEGEKDLSIVYTPIHGSGLVPVIEGLKNFGFDRVHIVQEQAVQDSRFPTVPYPNPEEREAFQLAIEQGERLSADLLLATDPDADRLGVAVRTPSGTYELLTGNQLGALLIDYLLSMKKQNDILPENGVLLKTIVTSEFGRAIAESFDVETMNTLTGFKFISEKIAEFERTGAKTFLLGYEESYGYLIGTFARDKDAVQAAVLTAEMAAYYKKSGSSLFERLQDLYQKFSYYGELLESITLEGKDGQAKIQAIIERFRTNPPTEIAGEQVTICEDYKIGERKLADGTVERLTLPTSDVLKFYLQDGSWFCIRPSGTEPKCKIYIAVKKSSSEERDAALTSVLVDVKRYITA